MPHTRVRIRRTLPPAAAPLSWTDLWHGLTAMFQPDRSIRRCLYWLPASLPFLRLGETIFPSEIPLRPLSATKAGLLAKWQRHLTRSNRARRKTAADFGRRLSFPL